jgi:hypothetical protein
LDEFFSDNKVSSDITKNEIEKTNDDIENWLNGN